MMSIIENHILSIVNNNDGISAFYENYLEHDYDFNGYIAEIEMNNNYTLNSYQYDYNIFKYEIMNEIYGDVAQEQFFNNTIRVLVKDITDADKHIMFKFLITEAKKSFGNAVGNLVDDYVEDNWQSIISSYVLEKVNRMILDEDDWIQYSIINRIEDEVRDRLRTQVIREIAFNKIKRNKIFNLGLGLKLSIKNCGVIVGV